MSIDLQEHGPVGEHLERKVTVQIQLLDRPYFSKFPEHILRTSSVRCQEKNLLDVFNRTRKPEAIAVWQRVSLSNLRSAMTFEEFDDGKHDLNRAYRT